MNEDTLYELLDGLEWKDLELKESKTKVPESAYESVSAFLNTEGGHIVLGVNDKKEIISKSALWQASGDARSGTRQARVGHRGTSGLGSRTGMLWFLYAFHLKK